MKLLEVIFWFCLAGVIYAYAVYPVVIWVCARVFGRKLVRPVVADDQLPTVTLLISAYNEESVIADRLDNALRADYPAGLMRIVVASDGSSDTTVKIVERYADRGVRLLDYTKRRGKASVLNSAMAEIDTEVR